MAAGSRIGPGTIRVGEFIGRLGVVSLPTVATALDIDERVVRRHVAKLEAAGWLGRGAWLWGEGSIAWLTPAGIEALGLGGLRGYRSQPAPTTVAHALLVGWSAARNERLGNDWYSSRELAAAGRERWAIPVRGEHGYATRLPDLAVWRPGAERPAAIVAEQGGRRYDRQTAIVEGWRDAIVSERYTRVRCDCVNEPLAASLTRLAKKVGLNSRFHVMIQTTSEEIESLQPLSRADADGGSQEAA